MDETLVGFPTVRTHRCEIVPLVPADAAAVQSITDDRAITDAVDFLQSPFRLVDAEALIDRNVTGNNCFLGVWIGKPADLIGVIGVHLCPPADMEIGYWIASQFHGQGYATETVSVVVRQCRQTFPKRRIFAECLPANSSSWRVLEKLGFHDENETGNRPGRRRLRYAG